MERVGCSESLIAGTTSHINEVFSGSERQYHDFLGLQQDTDIADDFRLALKKLEGLMYAALGSVPKSYAYRQQWWLSSFPRCQWPEQTFCWMTGRCNDGVAGYDGAVFRCDHYQTAQQGRVGGAGLGENASIGSTGYFDWSRSDQLNAQYKRTYHTVDWFPYQSIVRSYSDDASNYADPPADTEVEITWTCPAGKIASIDKVYIIIQYGLAASSRIQLTSTDGGTTWTYKSSGRPHNTRVLFYIEVLDTDGVTWYDPFGDDAHTPPAVPLIVDGEVPGSGHNSQSPGTCYYFYYFTHSTHPYMNGFPELIWEEYTVSDPAKAVALKKCTGTWRFKPYTTIKPALINLARFCLDYLGSYYHHSPALRRDTRCCYNFPIYWRWSGSNKPWLYQSGGKTGTAPLHGMETASGSEAARLTWRGSPLLHPNSGMANSGWGAWEYGMDESWKAWPTFASFEHHCTANNPECDYWRHPGRFIYHGRDRGLKEGDMIEKIHLQEIIDAVNYLCTNGLWYPRVIESCKKTPPSCTTVELVHGDYFYEFLSEDSVSNLMYHTYDCRKGCFKTSTCVYPYDTPGTNWDAPVDVAECRTAAAAGVYDPGDGRLLESGVCQISSGWEVINEENCTLEGVVWEYGSSELKKWCWSEDRAFDGLAKLNAFYSRCSVAQGSPCECQFKTRRWGQSTGFSAYMCGPPQYNNSPGSSGNWSHPDEYHGNIFYKQRFGDHGSASWQDQRGPQYSRSMGNRSNALMTCDMLTPTVQGFNQVMPVHWEGPTQTWATPGERGTWMRQGENCAPPISRFVPALPGFEDYNDIGTATPLCTEYELDDGLGFEIPACGGYKVSVICEVHSIGYCTSPFVWVNVDLNANLNGIPQLYDYDLSIVKTSGGVPISPSVYPDDVTEYRSADCIFTEDNVQCMFDTWIE